MLTLVVEKIDILKAFHTKTQLTTHSSPYRGVSVRKGLPDRDPLLLDGDPSEGTWDQTVSLEGT